LHRRRVTSSAPLFDDPGPHSTSAPSHQQTCAAPNALPYTKHRPPEPVARKQNVFSTVHRQPYATTVSASPSVWCTRTQMSDMATWKSSSTGGSSQTSKASTLFGLDEEDKADILVYRYRSGCKALELSTQRDLCRELDAGKLESQLLRAASLTAGGFHRPAAAFHARYQEGDSSRQQSVGNSHRGPSLARGP
jgi:hypothetical protein